MALAGGAIQAVRVQLVDGKLKFWGHALVNRAAVTTNLAEVIKAIREGKAPYMVGQADVMKELQEKIANDNGSL